MRPWTVEALLATLAAMDCAGGAGKAGVLLLGRYAVSGRQAREVEGCVEVDGRDTEGDAASVRPGHPVRSARSPRSSLDSCHQSCINTRIFRFRYV